MEIINLEEVTKHESPKKEEEKPFYEQSLFERMAKKGYNIKDYSKPKNPSTEPIVPKASYLDLEQQLLESADADGSLGIVSKKKSKRKRCILDSDDE
jgi:hypothetical protein